MLTTYLGLHYKFSKYYLRIYCRMSSMINGRGLRIAYSTYNEDEKLILSKLWHKGTSSPNSALEYLRTIFKWSSF